MLFKYKFLSDNENGNGATIMGDYKMPISYRESMEGSLGGRCCSLRAFALMTTMLMSLPAFAEDPPVPSPPSPQRMDAAEQGKVGENSAPAEKIKDLYADGEPANTPRLEVLFRQRSADGKLVPCLPPQKHVNLVGVTARWSGSFDVGTGFRLPVGEVDGKVRLRFGAKYRLALSDDEEYEIVVPREIPPGTATQVVIVVGEGATPKLPIAPPLEDIAGRFEGFGNGGKPDWKGWQVLYYRTRANGTSSNVSDRGEFKIERMPLGGALVVCSAQGDWEIYVPKVTTRTVSIRKGDPANVERTKPCRNYLVRLDPALVPAGTVSIGFFLNAEAFAPLSGFVYHAGSDNGKVRLAPGTYTVRAFAPNPDKPEEPLLVLLQDSLVVPDNVEVKELSLKINATSMPAKGK